MAFYSTEYEVQRWCYTHYSKENPRDSGYCEDQGARNILVKRWKMLGITIWKWIVDREEIPAFVLAKENSYGSYSGSWKSKFEVHL